MLPSSPTKSCRSTNFVNLIIVRQWRSPHAHWLFQCKHSSCHHFSMKKPLCLLLTIPTCRSLIDQQQLPPPPSLSIFLSTMSTSSLHLGQSPPLHRPSAPANDVTSDPLPSVVFCSFSLIDNGWFSLSIINCNLSNRHLQLLQVSLN